MNENAFSRRAGRAIGGFDATAHALIGAWRTGGEKLGAAARERWDAALERSAPRLSPETQRNANHARDVFGDLYTRGVRLSAGGAEVAVDTLVQVARTAVDRAARWQHGRA